MEYFKYLKKFIEDGLNAQLSDEEESLRPFCIYADVGDFDYAKRNINDIVGKKYGVLSLVGSNISPLTTLKFAEITAQCEIVVNVDEMESDPEDPTCMHYAPVAEARKAIENFIAESNAVSFYNDGYAITPSFELATAGSFVVATSNLGKIVPLRFTARCVFVQNGVSSDSVKYTVTYDDTDYELYAIQASENMIGTSEGQTHTDDPKVSNTIQEAKYSFELSMPLTNNELCKYFLSLLHNGVQNTPLPIAVTYDEVGLTFQHQMLVNNISLSVQRPQNVGINLSFIEADETISI